MSIPTVITMGFGSFGDIAHVVTHGFDIGSDVAPPDQGFFGGGPFTKRYGYDPRYYSQEDRYSEAKDLRDELPGPIAEHVEEAIFKAVEAVREDKPEQFLDAQKVYDRVFGSVRYELRKELWRAEIERRIHEEDEMEDVQFLSIISDD